MHRAAYQAMGLTGWTYEAHECDEARLPALLDSADWAGLSLTMPLKRAVLPLLDTVSDLAVEVGGANTVVFTDGVRHGDNTDVYGIERALGEAGVPAPGSALVLGAGATAASALAALRNLGLRTATLVARDRARAGETIEVAERLGVALAVGVVRQARGAAGGRPGGLHAAGRRGRLLRRSARARARACRRRLRPWPTRLAASVEAEAGRWSAASRCCCTRRSGRWS
ncbi:hypothetical protein GCM10020219_003930 [Nonomuraea dietziae]